MRKANAYGQQNEYLLAARLGLSALGIRHPRRRAEILEQLARHDDEGLESQGVPPVNAFRACLEAPFIEACSRPSAPEAGELTELAPTLDDAERRQLAAIPPELRAAYLFNLQHPLFGGGALEQTSGLRWLPKVALSEARDFYLPQAYVARTTGFDPKHALRLIELRRRAEGAPSRTLKLRHAPPGRNDACPCTSGRKYKKCCGNN